MPARSERPPARRFAARLSDAELVSAVREIARTVRPAEPGRVSRAEWNAAVRSGRWPGVPQAAGVRKRFGGIPWAELLTLALDEGRDLVKTAEARTRRPPTPPPDPEAITVALRITDAYVDPDDPGFGRPDRHDQVRGQLVARMRRRWRHGSNADALLPDRYEIENACAQPGGSGWDNARHAAGVPARRAAPGARRGNDPVDMALRMGAELGVLPASLTHLRAYAKAKNESLAAYGGAIGPINTQANQIRVAADLTPLPTAPPGSREVGAAPTNLADVVNPRRGDWATREQFVAGLARAFEEIGVGARLTQVTQRRLAKAHPGVIPYPSNVQKFVERHPKLGITASDLREEGRAAARRGAATDRD